MSELNRICALIYHLKKDTSNLVLQKLLYFIQAYSLVAFSRPAFDEKIEAWMYGPVVPEVYYNLKSNKNYYKDIDFRGIDPQLEDSVRKIVEAFGEISPFVLVDMTHTYDSWRNAWNQGGWNTEITNEEIRNCHIRRFREQAGRIF